MKAILSIFLMLQIVFSSMSVTISMHYCLGELADVGVFEDAEVCAYEKYLLTEITTTDDCEITNKTCCGHERHEILGQDHNTTLKSKKVENPSNKIQLVPIIKVTNTSFQLTPTAYQLLKPPLIEPPIFLQVQSFRL